MTCLNTVDYSTVPGNRILPYVLTLDVEASNLNPAVGENQRFCYRVEAVGEDTSLYVNLSHFLLGACPELTEADILSAEVTINGVAQTVILGENVEVRTFDSPDPTTGCTGIKFNFGLDKVAGRMSLCFTLARTFAIGPVVACLKAGQETRSSLSICGPACAATESCDTLVNQQTTVCVPVTVTPFATTGVITTQCCGQPVIQPGIAECAGAVNTSCTFTVSQDLCISVPIGFGAVASPGTARSVCGQATVGACACGTQPTAAARAVTRCRCRE